MSNYPNPLVKEFDEAIKNGMAKLGRDGDNVLLIEWQRTNPKRLEYRSVNFVIPVMSVEAPDGAGGRDIVSEVGLESLGPRFAQWAHKTLEDLGGNPVPLPSSLQDHSI